MTPVSWAISEPLHLLEFPLLGRVSFLALHLEKGSSHLRPELQQMLVSKELGDSLSLEIVLSQTQRLEVLNLNLLFSV